MYGKSVIQVGKINSKGSDGYSGPGQNVAGGGASGGGSINIFYWNSLFLGKINTSGGNGGPSRENYGGNGGEGSITIGSISSGTFIKDEENQE